MSARVPMVASGAGGAWGHVGLGRVGWGFVGSGIDIRITSYIYTCKIDKSSFPA